MYSYKKEHEKHDHRDAGIPVYNYKKKVYVDRDGKPIPVITPPSLPVITSEPQDYTGPVGTAHTLSVTATVSTGSVSYQWSVDGSDIAGATSSTLSVDVSTAGTFSYVVGCTSDTGKSVPSRTAIVTITH